VDAVTHALLGAHLAWQVQRQRGPGRQAAVAARTPEGQGRWARDAAEPDAVLSPRQGLLLGAVAAAAPDIDFIGFRVDPLRFLADWHQGPTHSLLLLPLWAVLLALCCAAMLRRRSAWVPAFIICASALASHVALDVITAYGTQLLYPWSARRFSLGLAFVIDPVITVLLAASLAAALYTGRRRVALVGLLMVGVHVAGLAVLKQQALRVAADAAATAGAVPGGVHALPQPFSPFNWKLLVVLPPGRQTADELEQPSTLVAHVNLVGHPPLWPSAWARSAPAGATTVGGLPGLPGLPAWHALASAYVAPHALVWTQRPLYGQTAAMQALAATLWARPDFDAFRRFAVHPALSGVNGPDGADGEAPQCLWFTDLRYDLPGWPDTFRYGYCRQAADASWRAHRLRYFSQDTRVPLRSHVPPHADK
jgi:inner membrane protein